MDNESNLKPQHTGGLKLMTVFVVVLALHVVVIGGMTAYYMLKGGSADVDLTDKTTKPVKITPDGTIVGDSTAPDSTQGDKTASTAPADGSVTASTTPAPEPAAALQPDKVPATPVAPVPATSVLTSATPTGPVISPTVPLVPAPMSPVLTASAPAATTPTSGPEGATYSVKIHDSLARIAHKNHVTVAALKAANGMTNDTLHVGQKLVIPAKTEVTKSEVASTAKTDLTGTPASLTEATPMVATAKIKSSTTTEAPEPATTAGHHIYTVVKGDTLSKIAHRFKTTTKALMSANSLTDAAKLSIGEKLKIPSKESRSAMVVPKPAPLEPAEVQAKPGPATAPSETQTKPVTAAQLVNFTP